MASAPDKDSSLSFSFPPIAQGEPHTLILGTMPGQKSLEAAQYYAHPQNQFWRYIEQIYGIDRSLPYKERTLALTRCGVAVWDVVHSCRRDGSLDSAIMEETENDFAAFFEKFPTIRRVVFDSLTAEKLYNRHVLPKIKLPLRYARVPSPSPAYAKLRFEQKLAQWRDVLLAAEPD